MTYIIRNHDDPKQDDMNSTTTKSVGPLPTFCVTGSAAHGRFQPLLPGHWIDTSPYAKTGTATTTTTTTAVPDFLWENAPRHETRQYRDAVTCYSHLPNGTDILDSKWVLARLLGQPQQQQQQREYTIMMEEEEPADMTDPALATLEAHCFRGRDGFVDFCHMVGLYDADDAREGKITRADIPDLADDDIDPDHRHPKTTYTYQCGPAPSWWVIKDASSNGAGGIWVVGPRNAHAFGASDGSQSPLLDKHKYVAQKYAWPCVLYQGRKTHIRVYGLFTANGRAWVHRRCFLHVANDLFGGHADADNQHDDTSTPPQQAFVDSVHITNCCANSHNAEKFAGEICATLFGPNNDDGAVNCQHPSKNSDDDIDLSRFWPSIQASVAELAHKAFPFLQGGTSNNGLEYLGLDFILSYNAQGQPLAYLLEVNAPPSQDTATGLPHAEDLHNDVLRDLLTLWVIPKVSTATTSRPGGWRCVYQHADYPFGDSKAVPSKAAVLNRMRWALFESKANKRQEQTRKARLQQRPNSSSLMSPSLTARRYFDYFARGSGDNDNTPLVFWENAGGTQVPRQVIAHMTASLQHRHRNVVGAELKESARQAMAKLLGANGEDDYEICFGANATALLAKTAALYASHLTATDEIVLSMENHRAHVEPWMALAEHTGTRLVWWDPALPLEDILTADTRLVALTHASNVVGRVRDMAGLVSIVRKRAPRAHVVVDGVAAAPHVYAAVQDTGVDYYVVSCHKLFGPHLGVLCGKRATLQQFSNGEKRFTDLYEAGTMNYDACAGVQGMLEYFQALDGSGREEDSSDEMNGVEKAYSTIGMYEDELTRVLMESLRRCPKVHMLATHGKALKDLPVVSFVHDTIPCPDLVDLCAKQGFIYRHDTFLSSSMFLEQHPRFAQGFVRFSLVHYNTLDEVQKVISYLESLPGWF